MANQNPVQGIYVISSEWVKNPLKSVGQKSGWILTFMVKTDDLIQHLPLSNAINCGSMAIIASTKQKKILTETGWEDY
jgi:hypothetical protein